MELKDLNGLNAFNWWQKVKSSYHSLIGVMEKYMVFITVGFFLLGIFLAKRYIGFGEAVVGGFDTFVEGYGIVAPIAIFIILAPTLTKIFSSKRGSKFGFYAIKWMAGRKLLACLWGALATVVFFKFSILPETSTSLWDATLNTFSALGKMLVTSPYFYALYLSIIVSVIALKVGWLHNILEKAVKVIEHIGEYFELLIPLMMMAVGGYIVALPEAIKEELAGGAAAGFALQKFSVFGITFDPSTSGGMIAIYFAGSLLVALACFIWHFFLLIQTKMKVKEFSIKDYFAKYWIKVYPMLWATSSEALATPLNLYLTKKHAPWVRDTVRRFVVGTGSFMNINGTIICVYVLAGIVGAMLGLNFSLWQLVLTAPLIFLLSYGVPGIPGELVIFAGPMALLLGIPDAILPVFLALYVGLQLGLPDSFRTGNNSTDDYVVSIALNETYVKKFASLDEEGGEQNE